MNETNETNRKAKAVTTKTGAHGTPAPSGASCRRKRSAWGDAKAYGASDAAGFFEAKICEPFEFSILNFY